MNHDAVAQIVLTTDCADFDIGCLKVGDGVPYALSGRPGEVDDCHRGTGSHAIVLQCIYDVFLSFKRPGG